MSIGPGGVCPETCVPTTLEDGVEALLLAEHENPGSELVNSYTVKLPSGAFLILRPLEDPRVLDILARAHAIRERGDALVAR